MRATGMDAKVVESHTWDVPVADHDVVIIGAGMAGLVAAIDLTDAGLDVCLLERSHQPGGQVATDRVDGFVVDRGLQVLNTSPIVTAIVTSSSHRLSLGAT